jgi:TonB family protein
VGKRVLILLVAALVALTSNLAAQSSSSAPASDRKVASKVPPVYPELAKKMHIHGIVRVEAVVRPNGAVKTTRVLGGNPVLVDAALDAVGKWKFESAQTETTEVVQVAFDTE